MRMPVFKSQCTPLSCRDKRPVLTEIRRSCPLADFSSGERQEQDVHRRTQTSRMPRSPRKHRKEIILLFLLAANRHLSQLQQYLAGTDFSIESEKVCGTLSIAQSLLSDRGRQGFQLNCFRSRRFSFCSRIPSCSCASSCPQLNYPSQHPP